ncbi:MAG: hypothetical protein RIK87_22340 [Fuerstiella sp.]
MKNSTTIDVCADLSIHVGQRWIRVQGDGRRITIQLLSLKDAFQTFREVNSAMGLRRHIVGLSHSLAGVGLTVVVRVRRLTLLTIGEDRPSRWLRLLGH